MKPGVQATRLAVAKPLYSQVREVLLRRIGQGEWSAGEALPNEFLLSNDFGVSIGTIRRAIEGLEQTGVLKRIQGRGTYVAGPGAMALEDKFCRLRVRGAPAEVTHELEGVTRRKASPDEVVTLHLAQGDDVTEIRQRVVVARAVVGIETSVVAVGRFPRLETQLSYGQLVYRVLADYGSLVALASECVSSFAADAAAAHALSCTAGEPLLEVRRVAYTIDKEPVEMRRSFYRLSALAGLTYDHTIR
mgnify:FL=1